LKSPSQRLIYVDVLRALAIVAVFFAHLPLELAGTFGAFQVNGGRGVDLFFVLSGFLIGSTTLARAEWQVSTAEKFKTFWRLRLARIWPLYFGLLALYVLLPKLFAPSVRATLLAHPLPYVTFTSNYFYQSDLELGVLWSLAIEEQFYLAVGILVGVASLRRDRLEAAFFAVSLVVVPVSLRYRLEATQLMALPSVDPNIFVGKIYHSSLGRLDQLAIGILAALAAPWVRARVKLKSQAWGWIPFFVAVAAIVYVPTTWRVVQHTLLGVIFAACVLTAQLGTLAQPRTRVAQRGLWFVGYIGKVSFGLYLFHPIVRRWLFPLAQRRAWPSPVVEAAAFMAVWIAGTLVLAALSFRYFESPLLDWARNRGARPQRQQAAAA
jgi:peptidoglycan/LPS O-acetylase OafA/YrhL